MDTKILIAGILIAVVIIAGAFVLMSGKKAAPQPTEPTTPPAPTPTPTPTPPPPPTPTPTPPQEQPAPQPQPSTFSNAQQISDADLGTTDDTDEDLTADEETPDDPTV